MAHSSPTIIDLKLSFLRSQILLLSQPLRPSPTFQSSLTTAETTLQRKAIDDALYKLNSLLKKHNRLSYGPQAQRHVGEQIDRLYWNAGERETVVGEDWAEKGADYRNDAIIAQMPDDWSPEAEAQAPEQAARYKQLHARLVELSERRTAARERLEQYRAAKELLRPFENAEAVVQENLVTRDGEVERELQRMRMLMLRVERGLAGLPVKEKTDGTEDMDVDVDEDADSDDDSAQKKLSALLNG